MKEELQKIIGHNLQRIRIQRKITRDDIAERAGISTTFYANLESGNRMMSIVTLCKLAAILHVSTDTLLQIYSPNEEIDSIVTALHGQPHEIVSLVASIARLCVTDLNNFNPEGLNIDD